MATSGYTTVNITPFDYLKMSWELKAQSKADNTSTISWKLELVSLQYGKIISSANKYCAITIDGKTSTYDVNIAIENNTTKTLCSGAAVIPHNADGTKTFYYSCELSVNITFNGDYIGKKGGTSKGTLDTISRASTILVPSGAFIGDIIDITLTKYNNRYTHTVIAHFVTSEVTIYEKETISGNVISWRIPTSFYNDIPDRVSAKLNIYCITYDGDTQIGSHIATLDCGVNITENRPAFNPSVIDMIYTNLTGDGLAQTVINGYNTLEIGFGAVAQNGASIKEYKVQVGDITKISTSDYFIINNVTSNKFVFTVTDSRGITNTDTLTVPFVDYYPTTCHLEASAPTADDGIATLTVSGKYFNGSFGAVNNSIRILYRVKVNNGDFGEWKTASFNISYYNKDYTATIKLSGLDYQNTYTFQVAAGDQLSYSVAPAKVVKTTPVYDWGANDFSINVPLTVQGGAVYSAYILSDTTTTGTVRLNDNISNYEFIEIYYQDTNGRGVGYVKLPHIPVGDAYTIDLSLVEASSASGTYIRRTAYICMDTTITPNTTTAGYVWFNGSAVSHTTGTNRLQITKVIGYK